MRRYRVDQPKTTRDLILGGIPMGSHILSTDSQTKRLQPRRA